MTVTAPVPGLDTLIGRLDGAVRGTSTPEITAAVQRELESLLPSKALRLPPELAAPQEGTYARRLLHRSPGHGYSVLAMVWGPGQATPLHDHAGMWCVEGVLDGEIEVEQFDLLERDGDRYRFASTGSVRAGCGAAGRLIPPFEHHTIRNGSERETAITIHVYAGEMTECTVFLPDGDGDWYRRERRQLGYH